MAASKWGRRRIFPAEKISETLGDLLREAKVTTKGAGVSIPFSRSLLTLVELPRRDDPNEQRTVIELEARKYIPVPVQEVQLDWFIVPDAIAENAKKNNKVRVLLVAVHNDELSLLQNVVNGVGLETSFYELEIFSTIRSVVNEPVKPVLVLDIGASATKSYVVERGVVALSHNIPRGGQDVTRTIASASGMPISQAETMKKQYGFRCRRAAAMTARPSSSCSQAFWTKQSASLRSLKRISAAVLPASCSRAAAALPRRSANTRPHSFPYP
jgi:type IV pilus assembly protein PilM